MGDEGFTFNSTSNLRADGNDDGIVDAADYTIWRHNLGATVFSGETVVPEPATLLLLTIGGAGLLARRR